MSPDPAVAAAVYSDSALREIVEVIDVDDGYYYYYYSTETTVAVVTFDQKAAFVVQRLAFVAVL